MVTNDLVRVCASTDCLAIPDPVVLPAGTPITAIGRDASGGWVQVTDAGAAWRGWVPAGSVLLTGAIAGLPIAA